MPNNIEVSIFVSVTGSVKFGKRLYLYGEKKQWATFIAHWTTWRVRNFPFETANCKVFEEEEWRKSSEVKLRLWWRSAAAVGALLGLHGHATSSDQLDRGNRRGEKCCHIAPECCKLPAGVGLWSLLLALVGVVGSVEELERSSVAAHVLTGMLDQARSLHSNQFAL